MILIRRCGGKLTLTCSGGGDDHVRRAARCQGSQTIRGLTALVSLTEGT